MLAVFLEVEISNLVFFRELFGKKLTFLACMCGSLMPYLQD